MVPSLMPADNAERQQTWRHDFADAVNLHESNHACRYRREEASRQQQFHFASKVLLANELVRLNVHGRSPAL